MSKDSPRKTFKEKTMRLQDSKDKFKRRFAKLPQDKILVVRGSEGSGKMLVVTNALEELGMVRWTAGSKYRLVHARSPNVEEILFPHFSIDTTSKGEIEVNMLGGTLSNAMKNGDVIVIEDLNALNSKLQTFLESAIRGTSIIVRTQVGDEWIEERIVPHENFRVVATLDEGLHRTFPLSTKMQAVSEIIDLG